MKEEHGRIFLHWILPIFCLTLIIIIMFFNFFTKVKKESVEYNEDRMIRVAQLYAEKVNNEFTALETAGKTAASVLADLEIVETADVVSVAEAIMESTPAYAVIYNRGEGKGTVGSGVQIELSALSYYRIFYQASNTRLVYLAKDEITGEEAILMVIPLGESTLKNLLIYYPVSEFEKLMDISRDFDTASFATLINVDGEILSHSEVESAYIASGNLWKDIDITYTNAITKAKVQIMNQMQGVLTTEAAEERKTLVYAPIGYNDWAVVLGINQYYVERKENEHWQTTRGMLYQLLAIVSVFVILLLTVNFIARKRNEENDKLLREKADTDLLTGLNNKLATERKIKEYMAENPNALAMMFVLDIDNFKKINDTMGHAFGDEVLRELGRQIGVIFRATDIIGRTGGDEFTIFLKFLKDDGNTLKEAQKLVTFFKGFQAGEYVKYSATASIGAAVFPDHGSDFETLYKSADKALYKAKQRGKNQLAFYDDRDRPQEIENA